MTLSGEPAGPGGVEILPARLVPLGGPRSMTVSRTLPQRSRSTVGSWCFCDRFGPDDIARTGGMRVAPHPHTGLQTVTWLFAGRVLHRDSLGSEQLVRPGELNLMTAGRGVSHSEESPHARPPILHGVQLWTALPAAETGRAPSFEHHGDVPVAVLSDVLVQVFAGSLRVGETTLVSPATVFAPLVGAQLDVSANARICLEVEPSFEHALLVDAGDVVFEGESVPTGTMAYAAPGRSRLAVRAGRTGGRVVLIGGVPFDEPLVMWWNFVGRTHEDVAGARADWQASLAQDASGAYVYGESAADRFGRVRGYAGGPLPAPPIPGVRLKPRARRVRSGDSASPPPASADPGR